MNINKNDIIELTIEDISTDGNGVGRYNNFCVFVPYVMIGELVKVKIIKVAKSYAVGKLLEVLTPSENRVEPVCDVFYKCGGCNFLHMDYKKQLEFKQKEVETTLKRIGGFDYFKLNDIIPCDNIYNYRNKAAFPLSFDKEPVIGFYSEKSHRVIPITSCKMQTESADIITQKFLALVKKHNIPIYSETDHKGVLRHLIIRTSFSKNETMVIIVTNTKSPLNKSFIEDVCKIKGITSLYQNINTKQTNVIMGDKNILLYGKEFIKDTVCEIDYEISPNSFVQINTKQTEKLYNKAVELCDLSGNEIVFDSYCGIGIMSLLLAKKSKYVYGIEVVGEAIKDAEKNAKRNNVTNIEFIEGKCEEVFVDMVEKGIKADVIVIDPPRKGCDIKFLEALVKCAAEKVVYVSCHPATQARDLKYLKENGYVLQSATPVDMFPNTKHVECLVLMSRVKD